MVVKSLKDGGRLELGDVLWWTPDGRFWFFTRQSWQSITDVYLVPSASPSYESRLQVASYHPFARGVLNISDGVFKPVDLAKIAPLEGIYVGTGDCGRYETFALGSYPNACSQVLEALGAVLLNKNINKTFRTK
ncbi:hypothetical protein KAZ57_02035 [Patescibacteria group bacterium]|nr:hypothetical protein [Patescibacteria group bacterium]